MNSGNILRKFSKLLMLRNDRQLRNDCLHPVAYKTLFAPIKPFIFFVQTGLTIKCFVRSNRNLFCTNWRNNWVFRQNGLDLPCTYWHYNSVFVYFHHRFIIIVWLLTVGCKKCILGYFHPGANSIYLFKMSLDELVN